MILDLPYAHSFRCIPPGHSTTKYHDVRDVAPFEVPSVTDSDAPVSCVLGRESYRTFEGSSYRRFDDGRFGLSAALKRLSTPDSGTYDPVENALKVRMEHLFTGGAASVQSPFGLPSRAEKVAEILKESRRGGAVRDQGDDRAERMARASDTWRRKLLVVDDGLWVASPEPRYMVEYEGGRAIRLRSGTLRGGRWSVAFRLDRHADAVAYGQGMAARTRGRFFIDETYGEAEVLDAASLAFDESDYLASGILDGSDYSFRGCDDLGDIVERRRSGDMNWARDMLEIADLDKRIRGPARLLAKDRANYVAASRISLEAWREVFRTRYGGTSEEAAETDEECLTSMVREEAFEEDCGNLASFGS